MKIVKFKGGLGNQLFQYAFLRYMEVVQGYEDIKADLGYYSATTADSIRQARILELKVQMDRASKADFKEILLLNHSGNFSSLKYKAKLILEIIFNRKYYFERSREYRSNIPFEHKSYFDGYWQSWRYVYPISQHLLQEISLEQQMDAKSIQVIERMKQEQAIFIGVRRGDYLADKKAQKHFGSVNERYYSDAINYIVSKVKNPVFYIFSNDIDWVKKNMNVPGKVVYREKEDQVNDLEELFIMASCKHAIISNSTYNWWGAWLIQNPEKIVIAPKVWFGDGAPIDIVPPEWIQL